MSLPRRVAAAMIAAALLAPCSAFVAGCAARSGAAGGTSARVLLVVLAPTRSGTRLVVVDPTRRQVVRTIALRSLVTSIDVDERTGLVVGAQTGGIGEKADDAISIVDPRTGTVRYVTLPVRDPASVVCVAGRAYVLHSIVTARGLLASVVDITSGKVVRFGAVPDGPGLWERAGDRLWCGAIDASGAVVVTRIDTSTLAATPRPAGMPFVCGLSAIGVRLGVLGATSLPGTARTHACIALHDAADGSLLASAAVEGLTGPATLAALVGDSLVVGDWSGQPPESDRVVVLDATTLKPRGTVVVSGVPCALAATQDRLLVVERTHGRLLGIDPQSGRVDWSVDLGTGELPLARVVISRGPRR